MKPPLSRFPSAGILSKIIPSIFRFTRNNIVLQKLYCMPGILRIIIIFSGLFLLAAQSSGRTASDTVWNVTDEKGWKQGYWKKHYPNGHLMYRGFFQDNKPLGRMERFYDDGKLKGVLK